MDSSGESKVNYIQVPQLPSKPHELYLWPSLSFSVPSGVCLFVFFPLCGSQSGWLLVIYFMPPSPPPSMSFPLPLCSSHLCSFPGDSTSISVTLSHWVLVVSGGRIKCWTAPHSEREVDNVKCQVKSN